MKGLKNTCKPENVLGKIPFFINQIGFPANRQTGTTQKSGTATTVSKFKMIIHLVFFFTNQIHVQKQFNAILSYSRVCHL
jgi:hypothetical protein